MCRCQSYMRHVIERKEQCTTRTTGSEGVAGKGYDDGGQHIDPVHEA